MILIIGGAYQGKLTYARNRFGLAQADCFDCQAGLPGKSFPCLYHLEAVSFSCAQQKEDSIALLSSQFERLRPSILIARDISGGVVPIQAENRRWREENGRMLAWLASQAQEVLRVQVGLAQRLA